MIKCIYPTQARKLGLIAATYRSGALSIFNSCPKSCPLLPQHHRNEGTSILDLNYLNTERQAIPRNGMAWSYTSFPPVPILRNTNTKLSTLNISTVDTFHAAQYTKNNYDVTYTAPATDTQWPRRIHDTLFIRCPAEINKNISCNRCGNGRPLCARQKRNYVIVFTAHGKHKKAVATKTGGCYAANFPCAIQWKSTRDGTGPTTWSESKDPERLIVWAQSLPPRTLLRHRVAGDLGCTSPTTQL